MFFEGFELYGAAFTLQTWMEDSSLKNNQWISSFFQFLWTSMNSRLIWGQNHFHLLQALHWLPPTKKNVQ